MQKLRKYKKGFVIINSIFVGIILCLSIISLVNAGTLSCTVRSSSCSGGETEVFRMSNTTNGHAQLASQATYNQLVCCSGVSGLGTACSGNYGTVLKLASVTNSHVQQSTQSGYANNVCLSVAGGGTISIGYQSTNCTGYDTTIASMSAITNAHVGNSSAYNIKICGTAVGGTLGTDIVDGSGNSISSPVISMTGAIFSFAYQTVSGIFGDSNQKIRVSNTTGSPAWTLSLAASGGATAYWDGTTRDYDFNDPTANAGDGGDADIIGGQMTFNPSVGTITPQNGCNTTGISKGNQASFSQGITDSITLMSASASAGTNCYWDLTGVGVSQTIPAEMPAGNYSINMTLTAVAS